MIYDEIARRERKKFNTRVRRAGFRSQKTYERKFQTLVRVDLLIIDDFGLKPLRSPQDEDLHDLVAERFEQATTIVSSNLDFREWREAFPNRLLGAATLSIG